MRFGHHPEVREALGLGPKGKLPPEGVIRHVIDGVTYYVEPQQEKLPGEGRRMHHRTRAICPTCGKNVSAGRLRQPVPALQIATGRHPDPRPARRLPEHWTA